MEKTILQWKLAKSLTGGYRIKLDCPHCGAGLTCRLDQAGTIDSCPDCSHNFLVPAEPAQQVELLKRKKEAEQAEKLARRRQEEVRRRMEEEQERESRRADERAAKEEEQRQRASQRNERQRFLEAIKDRQNNYRVVIVKNTDEAERICNKMGLEGWELRHFFSEIFDVQTCLCGQEPRRHWVVVFSRPTKLNID